jgi:hypothetical protein
MTVFYNQKVICLSPDEVALLLISKIIVPANIQFVKGLFINLDSVSFDKEAIFASEYRALPYNLSAEQQLLRINYTLEGTFRKDCLNICDLTPPIITPPPPTDTTLHRATFTGPVAGIPLIDYVPEIGNKWTDSAGSSGQVIFGTLRGLTFISGSDWASQTIVGATTYTATFLGRFNIACNMYIIFRRIGYGNGMFMFVDAILQSIRLYKIEGGVTLLATVPTPITIPLNLWMRFTLIVRATTFDFLIDGVPVFTGVTIPALAATGDSFGLGSSRVASVPGEVDFDNIEIVP